MLLFVGVGAVLGLVLALVLSRVPVRVRGWAGHWLSRLVAIIFVVKINQQLWIAAVHRLPSLVSPLETQWVGSRTFRWRVSWTCVRQKNNGEMYWPGRFMGYLCQYVLFAVPVPSRSWSFRCCFCRLYSVFALVLVFVFPSSSLVPCF